MTSLIGIYMAEWKENYPGITLHSKAPKFRESCSIISSIISPPTLKPILAKYADDTSVFSLNNNRRYAVTAITRHLKILWAWFLNVNKTQAILFCNLLENKLNKYKI